MDQLHRSYGPGLAVDIIAPGVKLPRPPTPPSARPCATGWAGTPTPSVACWWRATRCARLPALLDALGQLPAHYRLLVVGADEATRERVRGAGAIAHRVALIEPTPKSPSISARPTSTPIPR